MKTFIANTLCGLRTFYMLLWFISTTILRGRLGPGPREVWPTKRNLRSKWRAQKGTVRGGAWTGSWEANGRMIEGVLYKSWAREADPQKKCWFTWEKGSLLWNCTKKANKGPDTHFTRKLSVYMRETVVDSFSASYNHSLVSSPSVQYGHIILTHHKAREYGRSDRSPIMRSTRLPRLSDHPSRKKPAAMLWEWPCGEEQKALSVALEELKLAHSHVSVLGENSWASVKSWADWMPCWYLDLQPHQRPQDQKCPFSLSFCCTEIWITNAYCLKLYLLE